MSLSDSKNQAKLKTDLVAQESLGEILKKDNEPQSPKPIKKLQLRQKAIG